jgi:hypothetical protein
MNKILTKLKQYFCNLRGHTKNGKIKYDVVSLYPRFVVDIHLCEIRCSYCNKYGALIEYLNGSNPIVMYRNEKNEKKYPQIPQNMENKEWVDTLYYEMQCNHREILKNYLARENRYNEALDEAIKNAKKN